MRVCRFAVVLAAVLCLGGAAGQRTASGGVGLLVGDTVSGSPGEAVFGFRSGVDLVGGVAHTEIESPARDSKRLIGLAAARGLVVLGTSLPGEPALDQRIAGVRDGLARLRPGLLLLGPFDTKQDPDANLDSWRTLVAANPSAVAFVGAGEADAAGLAAARAAAARAGRGWIAGAFADDRAALLAARAGLLAVVSPESFLQGAVAGMLQATHARTGMPLPHGWVVTPGLVVTPGNVDQLLARQASPAGRAHWFDSHLREIMARPSGYLRPLPRV